MYIPIIKNRSVEMEAFKEVNYCFSEKIIPLVEIITDTYIPRYEIDPTTHKPLMTIKPGNKKASKVKLEPIENDKDTLQRVFQITKGELTFIDYFRYDPKKYGKSKIKITECELATSLSRAPQLYKSKVLDVCNYKNLIPVISIKPNFKFSSRASVKNYIISTKDYI